MEDGPVELLNLFRDLGPTPNRFVGKGWTRRKPSRPRDGQRKKLYRAEREAFADLPDVPRTVEAWNKYGKLIAHSKSAMKHYGRPRPLNIVFRGRSWSKCWSNGEIWIGSHHRGNEWVILHEAAHALTKRVGAAHGREFAACYVDLVTEFLGKTWGAALKASFSKHRVKYRAKRKLSPEQREALRARGRALAASRTA